MVVDGSGVVIRPEGELAMIFLMILIVGVMINSR